MKMIIKRGENVEKVVTLEMDSINKNIKRTCSYYPPTKPNNSNLDDIDQKEKSSITENDLFKHLGVDIKEKTNPIIIEPIEDEEDFEEPKSSINITLDPMVDNNKELEDVEKIPPEDVELVDSNYPGLSSYNNNY